MCFVPVIVETETAVRDYGQGSLSVPHIFATTYDPIVHHVCKPLALYQP